jgi:hypothetical protein
VIYGVYSGGDNGKDGDGKGRTQALLDFRNDQVIG